jgi:hypothetical protein
MMASPFEIMVTAIGGPEVLKSRSLDMPLSFTSALPSCRRMLGLESWILS